MILQSLLKTLWVKIKMNELNNYHIPVLLNSSVEGLNIKPDGTYVDVTFGGGGHSKKILEQLNEKGRLFAFDQDQDALKNALADSRFTLINQNFRYLKNYLALYGVEKVDGILADLGVSSHQFDEDERGFSIRKEGVLDMRMNQEQALSAKEVINEYSAEQLESLFKQYADLRNAKLVARKIVEAREIKAIETTQELIDIVKLLITMKKENQFLAQVFQAIRIEVNQEIQVLKEFLEAARDVLEVNGRLVVISYHSLEDRLAKNFFKKGNFDGEVIKDFYGNIERSFNEINRKVIVPTEQEIELNSRSRSARLRIGEKK